MGSQRLTPTRSHIGKYGGHGVPPQPDNAVRPYCFSANCLNTSLRGPSVGLLRNCAVTLRKIFRAPWDRKSPAERPVYSVLLLITLLLCSKTLVFGVEGFIQYTDPDRRFLFDYPSTMKLGVPNENEISISHPAASLRITVFVQNRPSKGKADADSLLEAFKKNLKEEMKDVTFLEQGKSPSLQGAQGYVVCSFKNPKGTQLIQLVQVPTLPRTAYFK